ncbi:hypothetical protein DFH09DRAFT_1104037 [Mycena vulgaris]|nr:hypothetical protein DFH09DRAFT_1104037 [Mycena vulgaris]
MSIGSSDTAQTAKKAARRREASRRYYARNPELREKKQAKDGFKAGWRGQQYKRQWDPPKRNKHDEDSSEEGSDNFELDENDGDANDDDKENWDPAYQQEVAGSTSRRIHPASLPHRVPRAAVARKRKAPPFALSEIDGYQSSEEDSVASLDDETRLARQELAELLTQLRQERRSRREQTHRARFAGSRRRRPRGSETERRAL